MTLEERKEALITRWKEFCAQYNKGKLNLPPYLFDKFLGKRKGYTMSLVRAGLIRVLQFPAKKRVVVSPESGVEFMLSIEI
jgi:hypothetical protein